MPMIVPYALALVFDLTLSAGGDSGAHVFDEAGTFAYCCKIHPSMRGTVAVEG